MSCGRRAKLVSPPPYTTIDTMPVSREKPYLFVDEQGNYRVRVPSAQTDSSGVSWADGMTPGRTLPLRDSSSRGRRTQ
jgi:hypothetical protein